MSLPGRPAALAALASLLGSVPLEWSTWLLGAAAFSPRTCLVGWWAAGSAVEALCASGVAETGGEKVVEPAKGSSLWATFPACADGLMLLGESAKAAAAGAVVAAFVREIPESAAQREAITMLVSDLLESSAGFHLVG